MVDYEKGTPSWEIGMLLTRHAAGLPEHKYEICDKVQALRQNAMAGKTPEQRLEEANLVECSCQPAE